ncbi:MAG: enoyl-CoA hydratase/isomerase family protein [Deltaproteobacteria bacterium]|nr:enoyl-CoA hydratase/isomerase family protein [Deltaproteobacteria bacterium]MCB9487549.1 enoyl-CoA hydratase/isomerase family protein [Deltaproteobacteria bacterium]
MSNTAVEVTIADQIAQLTINRPDVRNAINDEVLMGLHDAVEAAALNPDVRVVVIRGAGKGFSSGVDVSGLAGLGAVDINDRGMHLRELAYKIHRVLYRIEKIEKPVIAVVHRYCYGLAMELALACDFRVAETGSKFGLPEVVLGLIPDCGGTTRLTRAVGVARSKEVLMLGDTMTAEKALEWGVVTRVAAEGELDAVTKDLTDKLIALPQRALGLNKRAVDLSASMDETSSLEVEVLLQTAAAVTPDFPEILMGGVQALQSRK